MHVGAPRQLRPQRVFDIARIGADFLQDREHDAIGLLKQRGEQVLIGDFRMIGLRRRALGGLQGFLELLSVTIDAHRFGKILQQESSLGACRGVRIKLRRDGAGLAPNGRADGREWRRGFAKPAF